MLLYFKVGNYKSIKDPIVLNFNAAAISEHPDSNVIQQNDFSVLKTILLYGRNASGKTKILDAFSYFRLCILNSVEERFWEDVKTEPFALSETTEHQPSTFEICFVLNKSKYRYGFEVDANSVHKEWLLEAKSGTAKDYPVFMRINNEFDIDLKRFPNANDLDKRTRSNALFLSVASQWNVKKAEMIHQWIRSIITIHGLRNLNDRLTIKLLQDPKYASLIKELITKADLDIFDLGLTEFSPENEKKQENDNKSYFERQKLLNERDEKSVYTLHLKYNEKNEQTNTVPFFLKIHESEGTVKYFNIIGPLVYALFHDGLVIIDEFDARFHPLLSKAILKLFNSDIVKSKAQLLVASQIAQTGSDLFCR
jgi:AAA15 family ATPase/GTPase